MPPGRIVAGKAVASGEWLVARSLPTATPRIRARPAACLRKEARAESWLRQHRMVLRLRVVRGCPSRAGSTATSNSAENAWRHILRGCGPSERRPFPWSSLGWLAGFSAPPPWSGDHFRCEFDANLRLRVAWGTREQVPSRTVSDYPTCQVLTFRCKGITCDMQIYQ